MSKILQSTVFIWLVWCPAAVAAPSSIALNTYTCATFVADAGHPNTAAKLLRSMMMVSWATGFAAAHDLSKLRADQHALEIMGNALGKLCLAHPNELAMTEIAQEIEKVAAARKRNP